MPPHRILFIDAYDSFSNSIIALLRAELQVTVESIRIDDPRFVLNDEAFFTYLHGFDAVVAGPGPGHPANPEDVGLIGKLWELPQQHVLPVLGICLGFQSLCLASGAHVGRLHDPRHGIMAWITHCSKDIFTGAGKLVATQYHSLHVQLDGGDGEIWEPTTFWKPTRTCPDILPLAWDLLNAGNGPVLMGCRHVSKPYWGVQYHPESVCTNKDGQRLISEWWQHACRWNKLRRRTVLAPSWSVEAQSVATQDGDLSSQSLPQRTMAWTSLSATSSISVASFVEALRDEPFLAEPILLESGTRNGRPVNPETGRFSIIGLPAAGATQIQYFTSDSSFRIVDKGQVQLQTTMQVEEVFAYIDEHMRGLKTAKGPNSSPFWGGLVGYVSYEAGLETIDVPQTGARSDRPDMWFVSVDRSVVVDHVDNVAYIQTLRLDDTEWLQTTKEKLQQIMSAKACSDSESNKVVATLTSGPDQVEYCEKVRECQRQLRAGESYELCLTDQSTINTPADQWSLYSQLRSRNPAPFSAYLRLESPGTTSFSIAGTSPERFLSWSRAGKCQFRPIKGTVKKSPSMTRAKAEEILNSPKERAENLMIVDLIRHDLAGVQGVKQVRVPKLMSVEEYETVYQLVSVIEGDIEGGQGSGTAALAASLPPGSMTGAPKKRSCELLKEIEGDQPRGLYSGVIGYFDVGGGGDFSVVIRTAFKWDDEGDEWRIGAGGAITALSDPDAEWEEMVTKRESVLNALS